MNHSETLEVKTPFGNLHITLVYWADRSLKDIFAEVGKSGTNIRGFVEGLCRMINLALRKNATAQEVYNELQGIKCKETFFYKEHKIESIPDLLAQVIKMKFMVKNK